MRLTGWKIEHYKADVKTGGKEFKDEIVLANDFLVISNDPALTKAVKFDKVLSMIQVKGWWCCRGLTGHLLMLLVGVRQKVFGCTRDWRYLNCLALFCW